MDSVPFMIDADKNRSFYRCQFHLASDCRLPHRWRHFVTTDVTHSIVQQAVYVRAALARCKALLHQQCHKYDYHTRHD